MVKQFNCCISTVLKWTAAYLKYGNAGAPSLLLEEIINWPSSQLCSCSLQFGLINKWRLAESCVVDCPVSCMLSDWSPWAECSHTCGSQGKHTSKQTELKPAGTPTWGTDTEWATCAAPHYSVYSGIHQDVELCMNTFKCIKIFTSMCNPKPYYTGKQCAEFFFSFNKVYIDVPTSLSFSVKPTFLINTGYFSFVRWYFKNSRLILTKFCIYFIWPSWML